MAMIVARSMWSPFYLVGILLIVIITLIYYFGLRNLKKENRKYWLTGGVIGLVLWISLLIFSIYSFYDCVGSGGGGLCGLGVLGPGIPISLILMQLFLIFGLMSNNLLPLAIISAVLNALLFFSVGSLIGKFVGKFR